MKTWSHLVSMLDLRIILSLSLVKMSTTPSYFTMRVCKKRRYPQRAVWMLMRSFCSVVSVRLLMCAAINLVRPGLDETQVTDPLCIPYPSIEHAKQKWLTLDCKSFPVKKTCCNTCIILWSRAVNTLRIIINGHSDCNRGNYSITCPDLTRLISLSNQSCQWFDIGQFLSLVHLNEFSFSKLVTLH